jgi:hypothetical protein
MFSPRKTAIRISPIYDTPENKRNTAWVIMEKLENLLKTRLFLFEKEAISGKMKNLNSKQRRVKKGTIAFCGSTQGPVKQNEPALFAKTFTRLSNQKMMFDVFPVTC